MALLAAAGLWVLRSDEGTRWLLRQLPGLQVEGSRGALLDRQFAAQRLTWTDGRTTLRIDSLSWQGAQARWLPDGGGWVALSADVLRAERVQLDSAPSEGTRPGAPSSLRLPLQLALPAVEIGELRVDTQAPLTGLRARLALGASRGTEHRLVLHGARWRHVSAQGEARIDSDAPHRLDARLQLQGDDGPATAGGDAAATAMPQGAAAWTAQVTAVGPLSSFDVALQLAGRPGAGGPGPSADARAQLRPFEIWPLGDVTVTTHALDLAALLPDAPRTRLTGRALVRSQGLREPVGADIQLDNALPGRLDERGLPIVAMRLALTADPRQPGQLVIGPFVIDAGDSRGAAGRWSGSGQWRDHRLSLQTRLAGLQPARLDGRLAPMNLSGPLSITLDGLPSPDPAAPAGRSGGLAALALQLQGQLEGVVAGAPDDVRLAFDLSASRQQLDIRSLQASSGDAGARLSARLSRTGTQRWLLSSQGELDDFEPLAWVPGPQRADWTRGPHRFNARWSLDVSAPPDIDRLPLARALPSLLGRIDLRVADSVLAGLPLSAALQLRREPGDVAASRARASGELRLAGATLELDGSGNPTDDGTADRTQLRLQVPALAALAPLTERLPALRDWTPRRGELQLQAVLDGRWPAIGGELQGQVRGLEAGPLAIGSAEVRGRFDREAGHALQLKVDAAGLGWQEARIDALKGELDGTLAEHRIDAELRAPLQAPPALVQALAWRQGSAVRASLAATGGWTAATGGGGRWSGRLARLAVGADAAGPGDADRSWLETADLPLAWTLDADGGLDSLQLSPGRARSGALALRWTEAGWQSRAGGPAHWRLRGEIEPVDVAALLQRAPAALSGGALRWSGDLRAGAVLDLRAADSFEAELALRRQGGDLALSDGGAPRPLGITEAELRLSARDGLWRFAPRLAGTMLGRLDGEWLARSAPRLRWPAAESPLEGRLQARIGSLETLGGWLPPGWRLQGELEAQARLSGTLGSPAYTGFVAGERLGLRNPLVGVDLGDGSLRVRLDGETARIETLRLRAGQGSLSAEGQASFGAAPQLQLVARAERLRVLGRVDRQLVLSGQARLAASATALQVDGRIVADSGLFDLSRRDAPTLDEDVVVDRGDVPVAAAAERREPSAAMRNAQVALQVDLGEQLRLRGRGLDTRLAGTLRITAPQGRFAVNGEVRAVDGSYAAYGQKLTIERGVVVFGGPIEAARLDILALRPNLDTRVGVAITGSALDPRVRLVSEPEMPESDKLSWLVLGRGPDGLGRTDTALLQRAALALLSGEGESPTDAVLRRIGLDEFSVRQTDGDVRETVVSVGKQLGRRWYVGYERGVNATVGTWELVYRVGQQFTLRARSGEDNSLDVVRTWRFGSPRRPAVRE